MYEEYISCISNSRIDITFYFYELPWNDIWSKAVWNSNWIYFIKTQSLLNIQKVYYRAWSTHSYEK